MKKLILIILNWRSKMAFLKVKPAIDLTSNWVKTARTNLYDEADAMTVKVSVPGFTKSELTIAIDQDILKINGNPQNIQGGASHQEFLVEKFERKFKLPEQCDQKIVNADCENGILSIVFGKMSKSPRVITIA